MKATKRNIDALKNKIAVLEMNIQNYRNRYSSSLDERNILRNTIENISQDRAWARSIIEKKVLQ